MEAIRKSPATFLLIAITIGVFIFNYLEAGTFQDPAWTLGLLHSGALYNAFALDQEWYRLFTHLFLHGHLLHLGLNMYALYSVGSEVEQMTGTKKFLLIYFITGVAAGLASLYFNLFVIGVGASGAVFGLFGFSLVMQLFHTRRSGNSVTPILINFLVFLVINLLFAKAMQADNAAHFGGLAAGVLLAAASLLLHSERKAGVEFVFIAALVITWWMLPRYQVTYYQFFQRVLAMQDKERDWFRKAHSDDELTQGLHRLMPGWDSTLMLLNAHTYLPEALHSDTLKLRKYIALRKQNDTYRIKMIERESYIYLDSIDFVEEQLGAVTQLDYVLNLSAADAPAPEPSENKTPPPITKVWYDSNWVEIPYPPAAYYRLGTRDSLGRWQGRVTDYYNDGTIQMKGEYLNDERNGVFIYYSDHLTYLSAGRYVKDRYTGKWETYHANGRLESEAYYNERYFLKTLYDSAGHQLVKDGYGKEVHYHADSSIAMEGWYKDGYKEGYWYAQHANGKMYYEENYLHGRLINGRSQNLKGEQVVYDETSLYPLPKGGYRALNAYLQQQTQKLNSPQHGAVKLSLHVGWNAQLLEIKVEQSLSKELDEKAQELIRQGPAWQPAREHGLKPVDGYAWVTVEF